jgi:hypothetical protein
MGTMLRLEAEDLFAREMENEDDDDLVYGLQKTCLYLWTENRGGVFLSGFRSRSASVTGSVANAKSANVSIMVFKLIQSS